MSTAGASASVDVFLDRLAALVPAIAAEADREDGFPDDAFARLRAIGALAAPLPVSAGGLGLGAVDEGAAVARCLLLLGRASISVGRLFEGHLNAVRLVFRAGDTSQQADAAASIGAGALFGVWVTDGARPLGRGADGRLAGGKAFCSGAGHVTHALVTAATEAAAPEMFLVPVAAGVRGEARRMSGVRGASTADMALDGIASGRPIGTPGDYLRQPEFSTGAWRGAAVAAGALASLVDATVASLVGRARHRDPHQAARIGRMLIARDTARHWVERAAEAARAGADGVLPAAAAVATVDLARNAVEAEAAAAITLAQRSLGLPGMLAGARVERIGRDLATYLRQPAPDEALVNAAVWFAEHP